MSLKFRIKFIIILIIDIIMISIQSTIEKIILILFFYSIVTTIINISFTLLLSLFIKPQKDRIPQINVSASHEKCNRNIS